MRIGITGATGFIGSHLVRTLSAAGHDVLATARTLNPPDRIKEYATYSSWNITTPPTNSPAMDVVIHTAAAVSFDDSRKTMEDVNVVGTQHVLSWAKHAQRRILISSSSVYPTINSDHEKIESDANIGTPGTWYGQTKRQAESLWLDGSRNGSCYILRPHAVYGPGDRHLLPSLLRSLRRGALNIFGSGDQRYSITHVANLCQAVAGVLDHTGSVPVVANIADEQPLALENIFTSILQSVGVDATISHIPRSYGVVLAEASVLLHRSLRRQNALLLTTDLVKRLSSPWVVSLQVAKTQLHYAPSHTFDEGCRDCGIWVEALGGVSRFLKQPIDCWDDSIPTYKTGARVSTSAL